MQFDLNSFLRMANSPAGQQLVALLQRTGGTQLQTAVNLAASGNYEDAGKYLSALLDTPEAKALLKQLEDSK